MTVGDSIYARGELDAAGVLEVDRLWANIVSLKGTVAGARASELVLSLDQSGVEQRLKVARDAPVSNPNRSETVGDTSALVPGTGVVVIAFSDPSSGTLTATKVFSEATPPAQAVATGPFRESGLASFFECGPPQAACRGCSSRRLHCAWPKLTTGCGPFSSNCSVRSVFPRLPCGYRLSVQNPCNGKIVGVRVRDCGPTTRCVKPHGCRRFRKVILDLTPAAFTRIGNLNAGFVDVVVVG